MANIGLDIVSVPFYVADIAAQASFTALGPGQLPDSADIFGYLIPGVATIVGFSIQCPCVAATTISAILNINGVNQTANQITITNPASSANLILPTQNQIQLAANSIVGLSYATTGTWTVKDFVGVIYIAMAINSPDINQ